LSIFGGLGVSVVTKNYYQKSLKFKVLARIKQQISGNVIVREDIEDMGSSRQISRCFKDLVEMGELVKIGYGIYAKAYVSFKQLKKPSVREQRMLGPQFNSPASTKFTGYTKGYNFHIKNG